MSQLTKHLEELSRDARRHRLDLYIAEHYDEIAKARKTLHLTWADIAKGIAADGQRNANGDPPSPETVRMAFTRVGKSSYVPPQARRRS